MNSSTLALIDQAQAATTHSYNAILATVRQVDGGTMTHVRPGPASERMLGKYSQRALSGRLAMCPHIDPRAPQPAVWLAWAPGRIRCAPCAAKTAERVLSNESHRCDHCHRIAVRITSVAIPLPAIVVNLPKLPAFAMPPVQIQFGLCLTCRKTDQDGATPITDHS